MLRNPYPPEWYDTRDLRDDFEAYQERIEEGETLEGWELGSFEALSDLDSDLDDLESYAYEAEQLILVSEFEEYAEQLAEDIGAIDPHMSGWPLQHIDWKAAAEHLAMDYEEVHFSGHDYYIRSV